MTKDEAKQVLQLLKNSIPNPKTELNYKTDFELLVAVVLSAQCTDKRVNEVTNVLFKKYNTPKDFANMEQKELEKLIFSCGFYKNKAKNIIALSKKIISDFNGQVPREFDKLVSLPGVGRKTANVMLIVAFNTPAIPVDTHVFRVSNRIGLVKAKNEIDCENALCKLYNDCVDEWGNLHHLLILHGRNICKAQKPDCNNCVLNKKCKFYNNKLK